jgi:hypothetical protein
MPIHRRFRKAARDTVAHVRRAGRAIQKRRKNRGDARDQEARAIDERLSALADFIRASRYYESAWRLFCYGHFKGLTDEEATLELAQWARRQRITIKLEVRKVRQLDVLFVILRPADN